MTMTDGTLEVVVTMTLAEIEEEVEEVAAETGEMNLTLWIHLLILMCQGKQCVYWHITKLHIDTLLDQDIAGFLSYP